MAGEYVFNLQNVTKHQERKVILDDVNLAFFHGAHIGVIGANGAGKSSLLKILAGLDKDYMGTCQVAKNAKVGYLPQEPQLDPEKTVQECVMEGVAEAHSALRGGGNAVGGRGLCGARGARREGESGGLGKGRPTGREGADGAVVEIARQPEERAEEERALGPQTYGEQRREHRREGVDKVQHGPFGAGAEGGREHAAEGEQRHKAAERGEGDNYQAAEGYGRERGIHPAEK